MLSRILGFGSVVTVAALIGCSSSSSGGGGGTFTTSLPAGTKLTALTPAQAIQLCNDFFAYEAKAGAEPCNLVGLEGAELAVAEAAAAGTAAPSDAALQMACTQGYNSCLSVDGGGTGTYSCYATSTAFSGYPSTCQATVGDLQKCTSDENAADNQVYASLPSCSTLTAASLASALPDGGIGAAEPASCAQLDSTCSIAVDGGTAAMTNMSPRLRRNKK
jgi:hypothetical protein